MGGAVGVVGDQAGVADASDLERATIRHGGGIDVAVLGAVDGAGAFEDFLAGPLRRVHQVSRRVLSSLAAAEMAA